MGEQAGGTSSDSFLGKMNAERGWAGSTGFLFANCLGETTWYVPLSWPSRVRGPKRPLSLDRLLLLIALESKRKRIEKCVKSLNTNVLLKGHSLAAAAQSERERDRESDRDSKIDIDCGIVG